MQHRLFSRSFRLSLRAIFALVSLMATGLIAVPAQGIPGAPQGQQNTNGRLTAPPLDKEKALAMKIAGSFDFVVAGDLIDIHPVTLRQDAGLQATFGIIHAADGAAANMESNIVDRFHYDGPISDHTGEPEVAADVKRMGFEIVNRANNHATDAGTGILFETAKHLDEQGIVHAGTGRNLGEAREARFVELPKGRVGMVGVLSTALNGGSQAATYAFGSQPGMPGADVMRLNAFHLIPQEQIDALRKMRDEAYTHRNEFSNPVAPPPASEAKDTINFWGTAYKAGDVPGGLSYTMNGEDERDILRSIRNGKEISDFLVVEIHTHEDMSLLQTLFLSEYAPDFLVKFAHDAIDNGADVFVATGAHVLRGVEIYKGKPIFYGLAQFVYQLGTGTPALTNYLSHGVNPFNTNFTGSELDYDQGATRLALPVNFDSAFAECKFKEGKLSEVILHPLDLGYDLPLADRGAPRLAHGDAARRILEQLQKISKPFGTEIAIEGDVGVVRAGGQAK